MAARFTELIVDALDVRAQARWWAQVLGWEVGEEGDDGVEIRSPDGSVPTIVFVPVPAPKLEKVRLHIDISPVGCEQPEELERLLELGARKIDIGQGEQTWHVLADPEGNEFCLLKARVE